ncbi:MAG: single-stranded DNA-binding protein, partial [Armatimonadota bacterium]|nr:single-stranded DNA-binding protein [Armatimonadota bacterium]
MYNLTVLVGRLVADPEKRSLPDGRPVTNFRLAVDRPGRAGERQTDFIRIVAFYRTAEFAANYLTKGRLVLVEGRLRIRQFTDRNGQSRSVAEVVARTIQFMDRKPEGVPPAAVVPEPEIPIDEFPEEL